MMDTDTLLMQILQYAYYLPLVAVCIGGIIVAIRRRHRHPAVSRVVLIACICLPALMIGMRLIFTFLAQNAVMMAPGADIMHGRDVIRGAWEGMATTIPGTSWEPVMAKVSSSGDMAYVYGTASAVDADGNATPMKYLEVWVKIDGEWKVAADVFNANVQ